MTNEKVLELLNTIKYCDVDERAKVWAIDAAIASIKELDEVKDMFHAYRHVCAGYDPEYVHELLQAEQDGRLVVIPCKVGDAVWVTRNPWTGKLLKKPLDAYVNGMKMYSHGLYVNLLFDTRKINGTMDYEINHIGKTVFLTREEAEAALAKTGGNQ